jgi:hypothetical protein
MHEAVTQVALLANVLLHVLQFRLLAQLAQQLTLG